jgi:hypothetical protein
MEDVRFPKHLSEEGCLNNTVMNIGDFARDLQTGSGLDNWIY